MSTDTAEFESGEGREIRGLVDEEIDGTERDEFSLFPTDKLRDELLLFPEEKLLDEFPLSPEPNDPALGLPLPEVIPSLPEPNDSAFGRLPGEPGSPNDPALGRPLPGDLTSAAPNDGDLCRPFCEDIG
ncbi:hypothetical protein HK100_000163 [Physocladia obscura]|uniref:Uncharacterized protein n=1 Tax=Physocladia obscura TaxID=109957 RepID=A0AAD5T079_9FUNG|nr:hypothetical protein HK100_000163 [Physocladia obscura]